MKVNYIFNLPFDSTDEKPYSFKYFKNRFNARREKKKRPEANWMKAFAEEEEGVEVHDRACPRVKLEKNKQKSRWDNTV